MYVSRSRAGSIFLGIFLLSLVVHTYAWTQHNYIDKDSWIKEVERLRTHHRVDRASVFYGYPATTLTIPSALLHATGVSASQALTSTIITLLAFGTALVGLTIYLLQPSTLWWLPATGLLIFNRLYMLATPPSAVVAPLCVLMIILGIHILAATASQQRKFCLALGVCSGVALATRFDIALFVLGSSVLLFLTSRVAFKNIATLLVSAGLTFVVCNPAMWYIPGQHIIDMYTKLTTHFNTNVALTPLSTILLDSPLAVLSFTLALLIMAWHRLPTPLPRSWLCWLITTSLLLTAILRHSHYQPTWYFYPLFMIWETLLPLFILRLITAIELPTESWLTHRRIQIFVVLLLVIGQATMFIHWHLLPEVIFVLGK